jgi:hypothetical protein
MVCVGSEISVVAKIEGVEENTRSDTRSLSNSVASHFQLTGIRRLNSTACSSLSRYLEIRVSSLNCSRHLQHELWQKQRSFARTSRSCMCASPRLQPCRSANSIRCLFRGPARVRLKLFLLSCVQLLIAHSTLRCMCMYSTHAMTYATLRHTAKIYQSPSINEARRSRW